MQLLVYLLGIIGAVGSLVYSFSFSVNNHLIFAACIIGGILIYFGFNHFDNKRRFITGSSIVAGGLLVLPVTWQCLTYLLSIVGD